MNSKSLVTLLASAGLALLFSARPAAAQVLVSEFSGNGGISEYTFAGSFVRTLVAGGSGGLATPSGIKFGPDGNLYVASSGNGSIKKYDGTTGAFLSTVATGLGTDYDLVFGPDGNLYVPDFSSNAAYKVNPATGAILKTYLSGISRPEGIAVRSNGNLIVSSSLGSNPVEINNITGTSSTFATGIGRNVGFIQGPDSRFYFAGYDTGNIDVVPESGGAATSFSTGASLSSAQYIAYGNGSFYVGTFNTNLVRFFSTTTGAYQGSFVSPTSTGIAIRGINVAAAAPEPSSLALLVLPALGVLVARRRTALTGKV